MTIRTIDVGEEPNDETGDTLRDGGIIINENFAELDTRTSDATSQINTINNKLATVETGATKNRPDALLLARANHTGIQLASTISDLAAAVRAVTLAGLSLSNSTVTAADSILAAFGKVQAQLNNRLKVGDYGIGANSNAVWSGTDLDPDTFRTQGDYIGSFALNGFWTMTGYLTVSPGSTVNTCAQIFQANGTNEMYSRAMNGSTWAPWARMVRPGDYGVGAVKLKFCTDANAVTESGSLSVGPETANCVGTYGTLRTEFYEKSSGNFTQIGQSLNGLGEWFRSSINGSITPWRLIGINRSETTSGAMPRAPAGTNLNVLPDYCHRVWIDSSSFWGPSAADWLVEHTFIQPGYAWQTAQALNPDVKGIWTRVQNGGTWSPWAAPAVAPKRYQSAGLTFTNGQLQAVQHGLGAIPFSLQIFAVPVADQASWSAGIRVSPASGYTVGADATQIYIKVATGGMTVIDAQTGASVVITPANWRIEVRASI